MAEIVPWGPAGQTVYERTYSRPKTNGEQETWPETVVRVVDGNLGLVDPRYIEPGERELLIDFMTAFKIIPAGRHLWASGVPGRQFLFNCHVSGWGNPDEGARFSDHFTFQLLRSAEGGGVGANYSSEYLRPFGPVKQTLRVHIVCDPLHPDYENLKAAGVLSDEFSSDWAGSWEVGDSREGWADALGELIDTYFRGDVKYVNRVFDVSNVRPEGARLKTFGGTASGPLPFARLLLKVQDILNASHERTPVGIRIPGTYDEGHVLPLEAMAIDHALGECVVAGGVRRTARMSILHWEDPQIFEFINAKRDTGDHWTTNISVEIDDEFFKALAEESVNGPELAFCVLEAIAEGMLANGEPGIWNSSLSNKGEPNPVICTNPCGEIALEEWENCNLGHINLDAFYDDDRGAAEAHRLMARFLVRATYGDVNDPKQAAVLARNRRIGVGHFGYQGWVNKNGIRYSDSHTKPEVQQTLAHFADEVRDAADQYAFQLRIPSPVKVTTVAPTGSIAKMPGRTEGIHPIYARHFIRRIRYAVSDTAQRETVLGYMDAGYKCELDEYDQSGSTWVVEFPTKEILVQEVEDLGWPGDIVESVDEIDLDDLLAVQAMYQREYADNAVSFTANVSPDQYSAEALVMYLKKYLPELKGTTIFPDMSRPQSPYERITEEQWEQYANRAVADGTDDECANGACPVR